MANAPLDDKSLGDELPDAGADELRDADVDRLVLASGRRIERLARALAPERRDADGRPLMLGERMRLLGDRLDADAREAYRAWSRARNAYVHAERDAISDAAGFYGDYRTVAEALYALLPAGASADATTGPGPTARRAPKRQSAPAPLTPAPLTPAEAAALASAGEIRRKAGPRGRGATGSPKATARPRPSEAAPAPERPSVAGPVAVSIFVVALALAYNSC